MEKKTNKKLVLKRDSIRRLSSIELEGAAGGGICKTYSATIIKPKPTDVAICPTYAFENTCVRCPQA